MELTKIELGAVTAARVSSDTKVITDSGSALDLLMQAKYDLGCENIIIDKRLIDESFFILSSGLAGEILQKYVNYSGRLAIYGDFTRYTSKPLKDFIYESNKGHIACFMPTYEDALKWLEGQTDK